VHGLRDRAEFSLRRMLAMKKALAVPARPWIKNDPLITRKPMAINVVRYRHAGTTDWGVLNDGRLEPLSCGDLSTGELLGHRPFDGAAPVEPINIADVELLAPITAPCRVICQGANYRQHMIESGVNPDDKQFNLLFMKSDATLAPPRGDVRVPAQVQLLDYEGWCSANPSAGRPPSPPTPFPTTLPRWS
jgi:hypothetical protein